MTGKDWDALHAQRRFRPTYPSEAVVRFLACRFPGEGARLLDLGCGAGRHLALMADQRHEAVGVDTSAEGLRWARHWLNARFWQHDWDEMPQLVRGTMVDLPFAEASFDGAVAYGVLYYGTAATFTAAVEELHRVLRPGGWALLVTRSPWDWRREALSRLAPCTTRLDARAGGEAGMTMYFVPSDCIERVCRRFSLVHVGYQEFAPAVAAQEPYQLNHDWLIEVQK